MTNIAHLTQTWQISNHETINQYDFFYILPKFDSMFVCSVYVYMSVCMWIRLKPHRSIYIFETLAQHLSYDFLKTVFLNF